MNNACDTDYANLQVLRFSASTPQWAVGGPSEVLFCGFESDLEDLGCQASGGTLGRSGLPGKFSFLSLL